MQGFLLSCDSVASCDDDSSNEESQSLAESRPLSKAPPPDCGDMVMMVLLLVVGMMVLADSMAS